MDKEKDIQEELKNLSTKEQLQRSREAGLSSLLRIGYINTKEFEDYKEPPTDFPTDYKSLVVDYFCLWADDGATPTKEYTQALNKIFGNIPRDGYKALFTNMTINDGKEEVTISDVGLELSEPRAKDRLMRAEDFVNYKRNRIQARIQGLVIRKIAQLLIEDGNSKGEEIPLLKKILSKQNYRLTAESLSESDKGAIDRAATNVIKLLELAMLNGMATERYKEYKPLYNEDGDLKKPYTYRDGYDELLMKFEDEYLTLSKATINFYADTTPKGAINFLNGLYSNTKYWEMYSTKVQGTKFEGLIDKEGNLC